MGLKGNRRRKGVLVPALLVVALLWQTVGGLAVAAAPQDLPPPSIPASGNGSATASPTPAATAKPKYDPDHPEIMQNTFLYAETGVLIEQHSGKVFYDMKAEQRMQPASTTKIMTLLIALENGNLEDVVTVGQEINRIPSDSSIVPLIVGEKLTLE